MFKWIVGAGLVFWWWKMMVCQFFRYGISSCSYESIIIVVTIMYINSAE